MFEKVFSLFKDLKYSAGAQLFNLLSLCRLSGCMVTQVGCCYLASALRSTSHLKELDLSYNCPGESGVKLLTERLSDPNCTLEKLRYVRLKFGMV